MVWYVSLCSELIRQTAKALKESFVEEIVVIWEGERPIAGGISNEKAGWKDCHPHRFYQHPKRVHVDGGKTDTGFVDLRFKRDANLATPKLDIPSFQVKIRADQAPPKDEDPNTNLKEPINCQRERKKQEKQP